MAILVTLISVVCIILAAIWLIEAIPADGCNLHDWQPEREGGLRCARCKRLPDAD
jgi:hypothetical protein